MICSYRLTREQLLDDLYTAYYDARRHKTNKPYVKRFEENLDDNLKELCDRLYNRTYKPQPSSCFIITDPKKREVFAAKFIDRIVHHLYFNYTHEIYERTFIHDTCSCIKGRGTHFGVERLQGHIRKESQNYSVPCYAMYGDIRGYFMHIVRIRLLNICMKTLDKMSMHKISKYRQERWKDVVDMEFVSYLTCEIVLLNPVNDCIVIGPASDWDDLPHDKSLYYTPEGCGLPIGNLTSQLFSNVYLNQLDQFVKRVLKFRHYARYVDDFVRIRAKMRLLAKSGNVEKWHSSLNSYCGVLSHWNNFKLRRLLLNENPEFGEYGMFTMDYKKYHAVRSLFMKKKNDPRHTMVLKQRMLVMQV